MNFRIEALKAKDHEAWAEAFEALADPVFEYVLYRVKGDRESSADVTQEVFMQAIQSIQTFQGPSNGLARWLHGIARRILIRRRRKLHPRAARPLSLPASSTSENRFASIGGVDRRPLADEVLAQKEELQLIGATLTALPPRWERALRLKYDTDRSVEQIASSLGVTTKAAESLLSRARAGFRSTFEKLARTNGSLVEIEDRYDE